MEGERFPQKPINSHPLEVGSFFDDVEVSVEEIADTPEMKQIAGYLEEINETAIKNIFSQELRKSVGTTGTSTPIGRFIPKSEIQLDEGDDSDDYLGVYYGNRRIALNAYKLAQSSSYASAGLYNKIINEAYEVDTALHRTHVRGKSSPRLALDLALNTNNARDALYSERHVHSLQGNRSEILAHLDEVAGWFKVVHTFVHEELHAITDTGKQNTAHTLSSTARFQRAVGLQTEVDQHMETRRESDGATVTEHYSTEKGRGINEAVTQLISLRLTKQYLQQCPRNNFERKYIDDLLTEVRVGYTTEMMVAEQYIALISALTDVPEDVVLSGLWTEYLKNGTYLPDEFADVLSEHIPTLNRQELAQGMQTIDHMLSEKKFTPDSEFFSIYADILTYFPEDVQEKVREKLIAISKKYFGDIETDSSIVENKAE